MFGLSLCLGLLPLRLRLLRLLRALPFLFELSHKFPVFVRACPPFPYAQLLRGMQHWQGSSNVKGILSTRPDLLKSLVGLKNFPSLLVRFGYHLPVQ